MLLTNSFFLDIKEIHLAHKYVLDRVHRCEYPYGRGHYGIVFVLSGQAEYRFYTGERITVSDRDVLLLSSSARYSIVTAKEFKHYTVNFDIHEDTSKVGFERPYCFLKQEETEQLERNFKKIVSIWTAKKNGFEMESVGCLYELLSNFYFEYTNRKNSVTYQRLLPAKDYIEQQFDSPITLEALAKLSNMSVSNFRREWKKIFSKSPLQYRDYIRICYAKEYLNSEYFSVSEIAQKCGFADVSYFVRFFKNQTGITPKKYKNCFLGK